MSGWSGHIEVRLDDGEYRAFRTQDEREITIPEYPRDGVNMDEWFHFISLDSLEAFRQMLWDKWTWDTGDEEHGAMAELVEAEVARRVSHVGGISRKITAMVQQARTTMDITHIRQMQDRRNG